MSRRTPLRIASFSILSLLLPLAAHANLMANGSFEDPALPPGVTQGFAAGQTIGEGAQEWVVLTSPAGSVLLMETSYSEPFNGMSRFNARADHDGPDVGFHFFFGFPPPPPPPVITYGPPPVYYYEPAPRVEIRERPYYRDWRYRERAYPSYEWRNHRHHGRPHYRD